MHLQVPHKTRQFDAIQKVKFGINEGRKEAAAHNVTIEEERWEGNVLHFSATLQGKQISGTLEVTDKEYVIDAKLPLLWRIFEGKIEKMIAEQARMLR